MRIVDYAEDRLKDRPAVTWEGPLYTECMGPLPPIIVTLFCAFHTRMHYVGVNIRHYLLESPSPSPFSGVAHCDEEAEDYVGCVVSGGACGGGSSPPPSLAF